MNASNPQETVGTEEPLTISDEDQSMLVQYLRNRDADCPVCGYNLRDLATARCPECGKQLELSVSSPEPYLRGWLAAAIIACANAGIGVLMCIAVAGKGGPRHGPEVIAVYGYIAMVPVTIAILALRRRMLRWSLGEQFLLAGFLGVVSLILMGLLFGASD
jgi:hypothetical protein